MRPKLNYTELVTSIAGNGHTAKATEEVVRKIVERTLPQMISEKPSVFIRDNPKA